MKNKYFQSILSLILILTMLVGCGGGGSSTGSEKDNSPKPAQSTEIFGGGSDSGSNDMGNVPVSTDKSTEATLPSGSVDLGNSQEGSTPEGANPAEPPIEQGNPQNAQPPTESNKEFNYNDVPEYSGKAYVAMNGNEPYFDTSSVSAVSYEEYSNLDALGRCGVVYACIGQDIMPTEERGNIGQVKPSGWHTVRYDNVDGKYLYNRCHLIGYQLAAENANTKNLITGTRYLNIEGMLPFENQTADYVNETGNHVAYRVTPIFQGNDLLARGVLMEGWSVEDQGDGVCFCVFAYNVQPGIEIDYATGDSKLIETSEPSPQEPPAPVKPSVEPNPAPVEPTPLPPQETTPIGSTYILNTNTKKFHYPDCSSVKQMKAANKEVFTGSRDDVINRGYEPCKRCNP